MTELDFSKIFGETAASKASFTDENYLRGWGYLGSTPPPYQLFDYLQSLNDKKSKFLYDSLNENKNNLLAHNTDTSAHADIRQRFNSYLPLTGGTVTGTLNVPTQVIADNSNKVANTAFVQSAVDNKVSQLVNSAPETLDTLNELSNALGGDPNFATTVANMIGQKADSNILTSYVPLEGATMTGELTVPTLKISQNDIGYGLKIGGTTYLADVNIESALGIKSQTDENVGYLSMGNAGSKTFGWDGTQYKANSVIMATNGFITNKDTNSVNTASGGSALVIKTASNADAPNNGVVLEYGNSTSSAGQLYLGDNASQGLYWNGWSDGQRGTWKKIYMEGNMNDIKFANGTVLTIE